MIRVFFVPQYNTCPSATSTFVQRGARVGIHSGSRGILMYTTFPHARSPFSLEPQRTRRKDEKVKTRSGVKLLFFLIPHSRLSTPDSRLFFLTPASLETQRSQRKTRKAEKVKTGGGVERRAYGTGVGLAWMYGARFREQE
jgi:hypothetical protein